MRGNLPRRPTGRNPMRAAAALAALISASGCWSLEAVELSTDEQAFRPAALDVPGWRVQTVDAPFDCPDGRPAGALLVRPSSGSGVLPVAVVFHSGAFDYVKNVSETAPLANEHLQDPPRLSRAWGLRRAATILGTYDDGDEAESHTGAIAAAFVEQGGAVLAPANCWGDVWGAGTDAPSDVETELFERRGRDMARWAWTQVADPGAGEGPIDLGFDPDPTELHLVGYGHASRAVGVVLASGTTTGAGPEPESFLVDSPIDDPTPLYENATSFVLELETWKRTFPTGLESATRQALSVVERWPARVAVVHSSFDPAVPDGTDAALITRAESAPVALVRDTTASAHVQAGDDLDLARELVAFVLDRDVPDPGDDTGEPGGDTGEPGDDTGDTAAD